MGHPLCSRRPRQTDQTADSTPRPAPIIHTSQYITLHFKAYGCTFIQYTAYQSTKINKYWFPFQNNNAIANVMYVCMYAYHNSRPEKSRLLIEYQGIVHRPRGQDFCIARLSKSCVCMYVMRLLSIICMRFRARENEPSAAWAIAKSLW